MIITSYIIIKITLLCAILCVRIFAAGCKIRLNNGFEAILSNFINTARDVSLGMDDIEFLNSEDWDDKDEDEDGGEYILDVFVKNLRLDREA